MHECATTGIGRHIPRGDILEALDNGLMSMSALINPDKRTLAHCLARAIVTNDDGERMVELDDIQLVRVEGSAARFQQDQYQLLRRQRISWTEL